MCLVAAQTYYYDLGGPICINVANTVVTVGSIPSRGKLGACHWTNPTFIPKQGRKLAAVEA